MTDKKKLYRPKVREATGKLKECIDNQTKEGLDKARKQLEEESKAQLKVGDKVMYLNEEYVVTDNKDHYTLRSTKERTSVPVVHIDFGNEDYELRLVEDSKKCMYTKDNYTDEDRKVLCEGCEEKCEYAQKKADWLQELQDKLDSLSKEDLEKVWAKYHQKEETVSEDLEEAAEDFCEGEWDGLHDNEGNPLYTQDYLEYTFKAGAKWQMEKDYKDGLQNDNFLTFAYMDGLKKGKYEMKKEAVECTIEGVIGCDSLLRIKGRYKYGEKVKVIIVKDQ